MAGDTKIFEPSWLHHNIQDIIQHLPSYDGEFFNAKAYIDWELKLETEFDEHDLSEEQKIYIASNLLTKGALHEWKRICRRNKVPQSWHDFKLLFRDAFIPEYYADHLLKKLDNLKQGSKTVKEYYHVFKTCVIFGGLDECNKDITSRFIRGLNSEIQTMLISKTYNHLSLMYLLAQEVEKQILMFPNACETDMRPIVPCSTVTNFGQINNDLVEDPSKKDSEKGNFVCAETNRVNEEGHELNMDACEPNAWVLNLSTSHANLEQSLVEFSADFPLLQDDYKIVACDEEELCDHTSLISITQLLHGHDNHILDDIHAELRHVHCIDSVKDELKIISSLNCLGYIEIDFLYDLDSLENELFQKSGLLCVDSCTFHAMGFYNNSNRYIVKRVYICSDWKTSFMVPSSDQIMTCSLANNIMSSFSIVDDKLQVIFQEGEPCFQTCALVEVPELFLQELEKALFLSINHNAKPRTVCSQEGENDEDISGLDTTMIDTSNSKVKRFLVMSIFNTFDKWKLHHDVRSISFSEVLTWIKGRVECTWKVWRTKEVDWGPSQVLPTSTTKSSRHYWPKGIKRSNPTRFGKSDSDSRKGTRL